MKNKDVVGEGRGEAEEAAPILGNGQTYILRELQPLQVALLRLVGVLVPSPSKWIAQGWPLATCRAAGASVLSEMGFLVVAGVGEVWSG